MILTRLIAAMANPLTAQENGTYVMVVEHNERNERKLRVLAL